MVEDADDKEDQLSSESREEAKSVDEGGHEAASDSKLDDEYITISIWDELAEGVLHASGCTGVPYLYPLFETNFETCSQQRTSLKMTSSSCTPLLSKSILICPERHLRSSPMLSCR